MYFKTKTMTDALWNQFRNAVNLAYAKGKRQVPCDTLRDYVEDLAMLDQMAALLDRETADERRHRRGSPNNSPKGFPCETAAKLLLMQAASEGSQRDEMPPGSDFLVNRVNRATANVIGYLASPYLPLAWHEAVASLDYAKIMKGGGDE